MKSKSKFKNRNPDPKLYLKIIPRISAAKYDNDSKLDPGPNKEIPAVTYEENGKIVAVEFWTHGVRQDLGFTIEKGKRRRND